MLPDPAMPDEVSRVFPYDGETTLFVEYIPGVAFAYLPCQELLSPDFVHIPPGKPVSSLALLVEVQSTAKVIHRKCAQV